MTRPEADTDRAALYAAELAAFDGTDLEEIVTFDELAALVSSTVDSKWWPGPAVSSLRARSTAQSSSTRCSAATEAQSATIRLAASQLTIATVLHELAHALAGVGHGHDAVFRRAFLDVVQFVTNQDSTDRRQGLHVAQLTDAFSAANLDVGTRRWTGPPAESGAPFAL